jgi:hypothetical protein
MDARVRSLFNELVDLPHKEREKVLAQQAMPPEVPNNSFIQKELTAATE